MKKEKVVQVCQRLGFAGCWNADAHSNGGGLSLIWKNEGAIHIKDTVNIILILK